MAVRVFDCDDGAPLPMIAKRAKLVVWPGTGSRTANMNYVDMDAGEANVPHAHMESEDTIFIVRGSGTAHDIDNDVRLPIRAGQVVHVPAGVVHAVIADQGDGIVSVGGPSPPDYAMLERTKVWTQGPL
jgi:quercetin dioxygenase-like cupin family protein